MGITNIVLSDNRTSKTGGNKRITSANTPGALYVKFRTINRDAQAKIDLAVAYEYVARGDVRGGDGYGGYTTTTSGATEWYYKRFDVATDNTVWVSERDALVPGYLWSLPLDFPSQNHSSASIVDAITNGDWSFANRKYDAIHLHVKVKTWYYVGTTLTASDVAHADLYVGYIPTYTATSATLTTNGLTIRYSSPNWVRSSDRWEVVSLRQGSKAVTSTKTKPWGQVSKAGTITIPPSAVTYAPADGTISGEVRMNACWRPAGEEFASMTFAALPFENNAEANTPAMTVLEDAANGLIKVIVTDSADQDVPLSTALVTLVGGGLPSDSQVIAMGGTATFAPPIGEAYAISCIGLTADGKAKRVADRTGGPVSIAGGGILLTSEGDAHVRIPYDAGISESLGPESETVKLAGRSRPSAFFGEGGTRKVTVSGTVCIEAGHGLIVTPIEAIETIAEAGPLVLRDEIGRRMQVYASGVSVSCSDLPQWLRRVSITCEEVA